MDYHAIMSLLAKGRTYSEITASVGCSHRDVATAKRTMTAAGITPQRLAALSATDIEDLFPDQRKAVSEQYADPQFAQLVKQMKHNRFFTLQQGWVNYLAGTSTGKKYSYSQYCERFNRFAAATDVVATLQHEPGKAMFVDWAGPTLPVVDPATGQTCKAYFFVASLPYSGLVFCQAFDTMKQESWNQAHVNALSFYGGVPQLIVPDNARTATHRGRGKDSEVVVTAAYRQLAEHYQCAIVPARKNRPRDKSHVERMVQAVETRIIGYLASQTWSCLDELNDAVHERLVDLNDRLRRVNGSTRRELFEAEEAALLAPLPDDPFESVEYKQLKVGRNYHVTSDYQHYSVPYELAGKILSVRMTARTVSMFDGQVKVCEHARKTGRRGQYSTELAHAPEHHQQVQGLWSREWFVAGARAFGPATVQVITQILDRSKIEAQAFLACRNILSELGKKKTLLEQACQELLNVNGYPTYTSIKRIMATLALAREQAAAVPPAPQNVKDLSGVKDLPGVFVRDAQHYRGFGGHDA
ncbi:IS21 family transposase [Glutamicibacter protophormiae]|uniref:IS21 family transposase n=1 Tax=Glutamicibacter protophormiae TaxID=37930 RepID=UPI002A7F963F|nr:IS21 family transposase [Glutamicibacter protophormiae]WPR66523.1 IS21 family transposase [Glutamicibacter protophormiae]WPR67879.1 IS21 family transposase [Glutamicibacter protophormiae]